jgi:hypothetical protein
LKRDCDGNIQIINEHTCAGNTESLQQTNENFENKEIYLDERKEVNLCLTSVDKNEVKQVQRNDINLEFTQS